MAEVKHEIPEDLKDNYELACTYLKACKIPPVDPAWMKDIIERIAALDAVRMDLEAKLQRIADWCDAYPMDVFTEPDMDEVRRLLGDSLLTRISAHNFRHVLKGVAKIARELDKEGR
ncbi:hypothetical protein KGP36_06035 [Patescibacteria group bacterium]|nr:hypothetical protein [Patescibacteria group bacterium]